MHGCATRAVARPDRRAVYCLDVSLWQTRGRAMFHVHPVRAQDENGAEHLIGLRLHQQNELRKDVHERRARSDHLEHSTLSGGKSLLLLALRDITADDHAARYLSSGISHRPASDSNPYGVGSCRVSNKHFTAVDLLAAN